MSGVKSETKSSKVIDEINSFLESGQTVDQFTFRRWEREADSVNQAGDLFGYYQLMGMMAQLKGEQQHTKDYFQAAVHLLPNEPMALQNYSIALSFVGEYEESLKYCKKLFRIGFEYEQNSIVLDGLQRAVIMCCRLGKFIEASSLIHEFKDTGFYSANDGTSINIDIVAKAAHFMARNGLSDDDVAVLVSLAHQVYRPDYTHDSAKTGPDMVLDEVEPLMHLQLPVDGEAAYASELNDQLFDLIIENNVSPNITSIVSCTFIPVN